jgi:hypothetical protein
MGVHLYFTTEEPVEPAAAAAVREACRHVGRGRPWILCEPPHFYADDAEGGGRLRGGTKLNMIPHPDDLAAAGPIDPEDHDLGALLDALCRWSSEYGITWRLEIDGHKIGWVENGECDPNTRETLDSLAGVAAEVGEANGDEALPRGSLPEAGPALRIWREPEGE